MVDLTTGADDATHQEVTGEPSAPNPVEERLSETTVVNRKLVEVTGSPAKQDWLGYRKKNFEWLKSTKRR